MRTLNEQIQRLRDALVTCYNAIKRKGGTIPEAGERTLLNMPAAVLSIPQTHGVLTELNVTANGEYLPRDYDADGFSKVVANVQPPKIALSNMQVSNACIVDGYWAGESIDTSFTTSFDALFYNCSELRHIDVSGWNTSNVKNFVNTFGGCVNLQQLNVSNWNTANVTNMGGLMRNCKQIQQLDVSKWETSKVTQMYDTLQLLTNLQQLDLSNWDCSSVTSTGGFLYGCRALNSLIGGRSIDDVIVNNLTVLKGMKVNLSLVTLTLIDRASLRALINGLADLTGQTTQTLSLGSTLIAKLTEEDIAIATNKNWTIA